MSQSERNRLICRAIVACHARMLEQQTIGRRRLFDAVNELWAVMLRLEWEADDTAAWKELSRA